MKVDRTLKGDFKLTGYRITACTQGRERFSHITLSLNEALKDAIRMTEQYIYDLDCVRVYKIIGPDHKLVTSYKLSEFAQWLWE